ASGFNPLGWVREKVAPQLKEKQTKEEIEEAKKHAEKEGTKSVFDVQLPVVEKPVVEGDAWKLTNIRNREKLFPPKEHKYSTANFKISHRKLNMLANQISGKPIDWAILQMQFSEKRASTRIMNMLATAKDHASRYKRMNQVKLIVAEAWVTKGPHLPPRIEPRGRHHYGVRHHPNSKMTVVLREGKTVEEKRVQRREKILKRIVSAGVTRENVPLRNPAPTWSW
ncbi:50S ribosomal protein L22, partial [Leucoagaricus sp. SymC.cos]